MCCEKKNFVLNRFYTAQIYFVEKMWIEMKKFCYFLISIAAKQPSQSKFSALGKKIR